MCFVARVPMTIFNLVKHDDVTHTFMPGRDTVVEHTDSQRGPLQPCSKYPHAKSAKKSCNNNYLFHYMILELLDCCLLHHRTHERVDFLLQCSPLVESGLEFTGQIFIAHSCA